MKKALKRDIQYVARPCPVSMYEDGVGSTACKKRPELYQTKRSGSTSAQDHTYAHTHTHIYTHTAGDQAGQVW